MSKTPRSFIHLTEFDASEICQIFSRAQFHWQNLQKPVVQNDLPFKRESIALVFFESSTRTRMSFEAAAAQLGYYPLLLDCNSGSSLDKGETEEDTLLNIGAMGPRLLVVRSGDKLDLISMQRQLPCPMINAGWGIKGHPTQGLLDIFTVLQKRKTLQDLRLLIVGDVYHSRVASSHFQLAAKLGFSVAVAGPDSFMPRDRDVKRFSRLEDGLTWANVVMALRVQLERHSSQKTVENWQFSSSKRYNEDFGLNKKNLIHFSRDGLILHPGPVNWGTELDAEILDDDRVMILEQVRNGVLIRKAVIEFCLEGI